MPLQQAFNRLTSLLTTQRHRHCMVLCGDFDWRIQQIRALETRQGLWLGQTSPLPHLKPIALDQLRHLLGQETSCAVFCAEDGIDADALGIVSGMIQAGGLLWVLLPPIKDWLNTPNRANQRFLNYPNELKDSQTGFNRLLLAALQQHAIWLEQNKPLPDFRLPAPQPTQQRDGLTSDQQQGLEAIIHLAFGHPKRPLLIEADRGRGKTTLLGEAAAQLLLQGKQRIVISAARFAQVETAFHHAEQILKQQNDDVIIKPYLAGHKGRLTLGDQSIEFMAPDDLAFNPEKPHMDVLMIDEAAHLPIPLLQSLVRRYPRVVLSTTVHGYEGSGRGFSIRFKPFLDIQFKQWSHHNLTQPIRWNEFDPLEKLINQALLLDAELADVEPQAQLAIDIHQLKTDALTSEQLKPIFALLVQAHYQTSPADVQQLLSSPDLTLFIGTHQSQCLAVLLVTQEGNIDNLSRQRRVKGHLVPQLLRQISRQDSLLALTSERVMRLAVHPSVQRQGIASQLIKHWLDQTHADYVSASFGVNLELYHFWRKQGFQSAHLGAKRDKASGTHTLVMLKLVQPHDGFSALFAQHQAQLPHSLMEFVSHLAAPLEVALLAEYPCSTQRTFDFTDYINGTQSYETISHQLWDWTRQHADTLQHWSEPQQAVWLDKVLRKQAWCALAKTHQLAGRKAIETLLKDALKQTLTERE